MIAAQGRSFQEVEVFPPTHEQNIKALQQGARNALVKEGGGTFVFYEKPKWNTATS
jgi:hypothetical protein